MELNDFYDFLSLLKDAGRFLPTPDALRQHAGFLHEIEAVVVEQQGGGLFGIRQRTHWLRHLLEWRWNKTASDSVNQAVMMHVALSHRAVLDMVLDQEWLQESAVAKELDQLHEQQQRLRFELDLVLQQHKPHRMSRLAWHEALNACSQSSPQDRHVVREWVKRWPFGWGYGAQAKALANKWGLKNASKNHLLNVVDALDDVQGMDAEADHLVARYTTLINGFAQRHSTMMRALEHHTGLRGTQAQQELVNMILDHWQSLHASLQHEEDHALVDVWALLALLASDPAWPGWEEVRSMPEQAYWNEVRHASDRQQVENTQEGDDVSASSAQQDDPWASGAGGSPPVASNMNIY